MDASDKRSSTSNVVPLRPRPAPAPRDMPTDLNVELARITGELDQVVDRLAERIQRLARKAACFSDGQAGLEDLAELLTLTGQRENLMAKYLSVMAQRAAAERPEGVVPDGPA